MITPMDVMNEMNANMIKMIGEMNKQMVSMNRMAMDLMNTSIKNLQAIAPHNVIPNLLKGSAEVVEKTAKEVEKMGKRYSCVSFPVPPILQGQCYQYSTRMPLF